MSRTPLSQSLQTMFTGQQTPFEAAADAENEEIVENPENATRKPNPPKQIRTKEINSTFSDELDLERAETVAEFSVIDSSFRQRIIDTLKPALEKDLDSVVKGRYIWRHVSEFSEVFSKAASLTATVLAFASSSELTDDPTTRILAFTAGVVGSVSMVSSIFSNFARAQAIERSKALATIVKSAKIQEIPDVTDSINVQSGE
jgi:hypothetical protein